MVNPGEENGAGKLPEIGGVFKVVVWLLLML
jgi:hypothetical protein